MAAQMDERLGVERVAEATDVREFGKNTSYRNVSLPQTPAGSRWTVNVRDGIFQSVKQAELGEDELPGSFNGRGALMLPSLCHPHVHLDKAFLLSHPRYARLRVEKGDFQEAMSLTGEAKSLFEHEDLLQRGQRLIDESVAAGVTHMRAFVEVDAGVSTKCLDSGIALKEAAVRNDTCNVQLCAFAQLPLFSPAAGDEDGSKIRDLMREAARNGAVEAIGSTPYVEGDITAMKRNIEWMVDLSMEFNLHLDFHLDYNLDPSSVPLVWHAVKTLVYKSWKDQTLDKTVVLGHCTRLTLFDSEQWHRLAETIAEAELPLSFVGLPTSDLFMMRTGQRPEIRGTLDVPRLIEEYGLNACIGMNNIGNAFTPQGTCDPLSLACQGVGIYQAGTERDTEVLYQCVSTRAKAAIGFGREAPADISLDIKEGEGADFVVLGNPEYVDPRDEWKTINTVSEAVYLHDQGRGRKAHFSGNKSHAK